jgi:hypothetical protein
MAKKKNKKKNAKVQKSKRSFVSKIGSVLGGLAGGYLGQSKLGSNLGAQAGDWFGKITGLGDYKVVSNSLMSNGVPTFSSGSNSIIVKKTEFLSDVLSTTTFATDSSPINPTNPILFPWLSSVASSFEAYEFKGLVFMYKPTSGSAIASTNNALGVVIMTTEYDVLSPAFVSKKQMEAHQYTVSTVPSCAVIHPVECKRSLNVMSNLYCRPLLMPSGADLRFYDLGNFNLATYGMQANNINVGELWVSYEVELFKPQLDVGNYAHLTNSSSSLTYSNKGIAGSTSIFPINFTQGASSMSVNLAQAGLYSVWLDASYSGTGGATSNLTSSFVVAGTNSNAQTILPGSQGHQVVGQQYSANTMGSMSVTTNSGMSEMMIVSVHNGGDNVSIVTPNTTGLVSSDIFITPLGLGGESLIGNVQTVSLFDSKFCGVDDSNLSKALNEDYVKVESKCSCKK